MLNQKKNGGRTCTDASGPCPSDLVVLAHGMFWGKGGCISRNPSADVQFSFGPDGARRLKQANISPRASFPDMGGGLASLQRLR